MNETGDTGTVTLTADVSPFEDALKRVQTTAGQWSTQVQGHFGSIYDGTREKLSGWMGSFKADFGDGIKDIREKTMSLTAPFERVFHTFREVGKSQIAEVANEFKRITAEAAALAGPLAKLGGSALSIGGKAGGFVLEQAGAVAGHLKTALLTIGGAVTGGVGLVVGGIAAALAGPVAALTAKAFDYVRKSAANAMADFFDESGITRSFNTVADKARSLFQKFSLHNLLYGNLDKGVDEVYAGINGIAKLAEEAFGRALDALRRSIDAIWDAIREPVARVADWLQKSLVEMGLIEESTVSWGDKLRGLQDVGKQIIVGIAEGFGYLVGIFQKVAGYVTRYLVAPVLEAISQIYHAVEISMEFAGANTLLPSSVTDQFKAMAQGAREADDKLLKMIEKTKAFGDAWKNINLEDRVKQAHDWAEKMLDSFRKITDSENRRYERWQSFLGGVRDFFPDPDRNPFRGRDLKSQLLNEKPIDTDKKVEVKLEPMTVSALMAGSKEAYNAIVQARSIAEQSNPQVEVAKNSNLMVELLRKMLRIAEDQQGQGVAIEAI